MKATVSALLALLMLAAPVAGLALAEDRDLADRELPRERDLQVEILTGSTDRFGGGEWVAVNVGRTYFAVLYGNETSPHVPVAFVEYDRYLGRVEVYNESGALLANRPLPVYTVMAQSFEAMVEFRDGDNDGLLRFPDDWHDLINDTFDYPRKFLSLRTAWSLEDLVDETSEDGSVTTVDFNITARDVPYVWNRSGENAGDGFLNRITLAFHVEVNRVIKTVDFDVYEIVVDQEQHTIVSADKTGTETITGMAVNGTFKYDHYIEGWDFADGQSKLALGTHVFAGNAVPAGVLRVVKLTFRSEAETGDQKYHEDTTVADPINVTTVDQMVFSDEWTRVGRLVWSSDVQVDGETARMNFQVHRVWKIDHAFPRGLIRGFAVGGAFVYPAGEVIYHDPGLGANLVIPLATGDAFGLGPYVVQLGLVSLAVVGLVLYRVVRRKR